MTTRAQQIDLLTDPLIDPTTGSMCAGYTAYFYAAGTSTPKNVWTEKEKTNPFTSYALDSGGKALLYGDGTYKIVIKNTDGTTVLSLDNQKIQATTFSIVQKTGAYEATPDDDVILCSGTWTLSLQDVANYDHPLYVKNISSGSITIDPNGAQLVEGSATYTISVENQIVTLFPDHTSSTWRAGYTINDASVVTFQQSGTTYSTTVQAKLRTTLSVTDFGAVGDGVTSDQDALEDAVAEAVSQGAALLWPDGSYLSTSTLDNLHTIPHSGPGSILRGAVSFYPGIVSGQSNTLYCTTAGNATNDGLSATEPMTFQAALTALSNYGPVLEGKWNISLAAGTYTSASTNNFPIGLRSKYPVLIYGPDVSGSPNVPTAILDGDEDTGVGLRAQNGSSVYVKDVKFIDYPTSGGIWGTNGSFIATDNVHISNCYDGILSYHGRMYVSGGIFVLYAGNYSAIKSMYNNLHTIGSKYNMDTGLNPSDGNGNGPNITSSGGRTGQGVHVRESSAGHIENCVIDNLDVAITADISARVHSDENDFKNCEYVYDIGSGSNVFEGDSSNNTYNEGTADENDYKYRVEAGGVAQYTYGSGLTTCLVKKITSTDITVNDSAATVTHHTLAAFLKSDEFRAKGWIKAVIAGDITGANGAKTLLLQLNANTVSTIVIPAARTGEFVAELCMAVIGDSSQRLWAVVMLSDGYCVANVGTASIDLGFVATDPASTGYPLTVKSTLADGADEINVRYIEIWRGES